MTGGARASVRPRADEPRPPVRAVPEIGLLVPHRVGADVVSGGNPAEARAG